MSTLEYDLKVLCNLAKKLGATNATSLDAESVIVDERVRLKCTIPPCDDYGLNLMCPPYVMSVQEFRKILSRFKSAILIQIEAPITDELKKAIGQELDLPALYKNSRFVIDYKKAFDPIRSKLHQIVNRVEAKASMLGYRFATGFKAGPCKLCPECTTIDSQKICRHPYRSRPAMEAVGIDVFKTAESAGLPFEIPPKNRAVWNGLVLVD